MDSDMRGHETKELILNNDYLGRQMDQYVECFYRTQVNLGSDLWVPMSLTTRGFADLTDVTLADEDTNSILTDNANREIQGNVAMQVVLPVSRGGPSCN